MSTNDPDDQRPDVSAVPFRVTLHMKTGLVLGFPFFADAAFDNVKAAALWPDAPFGVAIIDHLAERDAIQWALPRLLAHIARKGTGMYYFTDDDGCEWGVLPEQVVAIKVEDPRAVDRKGPHRPRRPIGFAIPADGAAT